MKPGRTRRGAGALLGVSIALTLLIAVFAWTPFAQAAAPSPSTPAASPAPGLHIVIDLPHILRLVVGTDPQSAQPTPQRSTPVVPPTPPAATTMPAEHTVAPEPTRQPPTSTHTIVRTVQVAEAIEATATAAPVHSATPTRRGTTSDATHRSVTPRAAHTTSPGGADVLLAGTSLGDQSPWIFVMLIALLMVGTALVVLMGGHRAHPRQPGRRR